jgi:hypothetical protein
MKKKTAIPAGINLVIMVHLAARQSNSDLARLANPSPAFRCGFHDVLALCCIFVTLILSCRDEI